MSEVFKKFCEYAMALGHTKINQMPGCLELQIDSRWWAAINAHPETMACSKGTEVPPFCVYFECDGWPCAVVGHDGGSFIGLGEGNREDALIAALDEAMEAVA